MADTNLSLSISYGFEGVKHSDWTIGTSAPGAGDFELRVNATSNGYKIRRHDIILALHKMERLLESMGTFTTDLAG